MIEEKNKFLLERLDEALVKNAETRTFLTQSYQKKIKRYPARVLLSKLFIKIYPKASRWYVIKNNLFFGSPFYTEGYYMDYYLCGFPNSDPEIRLAKYIIRNLRKGDTFFDVGANFGFFTLLAGEILSNTQDANSRICAFEPTPSIFKILIKNGSASNITLNNFALGRERGSADFIFFDSIKEFNGLAKNINKEEFNVVGHTVHKVRVETLDYYCSQHMSIPTMIKIDVEGSEADVIQGGLSVVEKYHPQILMEIQPKEINQEHRRAVRLLGDLGYSVYRLDSEGLEVRENFAFVDNATTLDNILLKKD